MTSVYEGKWNGARSLYMLGGPAGKRNQGVRFAQSQYIAFFDDDVEVCPDALYEMWTLLERSSIGMVFGKTKNMEFRERFDEAGSFLTKTGFLWARAESGIEDVGQYEKPEPILAGKSAACMIRKNVFFKAGSFDVNFGILGEETDLAWRVWLSGFQVWWAPQSITYHAFNTRFKPVDFYTHERIYYNGCRNYITMLIKNLEVRNLITVLPIHCLGWFGAAIGMFLSGRIRASGFIIKGLFYNLFNLCFVLRCRHKVQKARLLRDAELFPIIMKKIGIKYYLNRLWRYVKVGLHG